MTRADLTEKILDIKREKGWSWKYLHEQIGGTSPVLLVGDIDRGGVLAHLFGTVAILEPEDQRLICGYIVNKFRGDVELLRPGLDTITELTGRPTLGVLPFDEDMWIDEEE